MAGEVIIRPTLNRPRFPALDAEQMAYVYLEAQPAEGVAVVLSLIHI